MNNNHRCKICRNLLSDCKCDTTDNKSIILSEINQYINTIILSFGDFTLYRLMGFYEDTDDYYYNLKDIKGQFSLHSCVMGFIPLKNKIDDDDYERIESVFEINEHESN